MSSQEALLMREGDFEILKVMKCPEMGVGGGSIPKKNHVLKIE